MYKIYGEGLDKEIFLHGLCTGLHDHLSGTEKTPENNAGSHWKGCNGVKINRMPQKSSGWLSRFIWVCDPNPDGTKPTNLTKNPNYNDYYPNWSPDGKKIVFESNMDGDYEIYVLNTNSIKVVELLLP